MTSSADLLRAFSQVELHRWGTPGRLLAYLGSRPDMNGVVVGSLRDAAAVLRVSVRTVRVALDRLEFDGVLVADARGGSASFAYRIQEPESWGEGVPWKGDRRDAEITIHALARLQARAQDATSARGWDRAQSLVVRGLRTAHLETVVRGPRTAHNADLPARAWPRAQTPPLSPSPSRQGLRLRRGDLEGGREDSIKLTGEQRQLLEAFWNGVGRDRELWGAPLQQLLVLGQEAGEHLEQLCDIAADPAGPSMFKLRVAQLVKALKEASTFASGGPVSNPNPGPSLRVRRTVLLDELDQVNELLLIHPDDVALGDDKVRLAAELDEVEELMVQGSEQAPDILEA